MTKRKSLNIFDNGKIRNMIRIVFLVTIFLISDIKIFANNSVCEKVYSDCFYNIPKKMITYYKPYNKVGFVNKNSINLRDIPIINSKNSKIILKLKKNDKIEIKKIFYLKNNTHVNLKLANSSCEGSLIFAPGLEANHKNLVSSGHLDMSTLSPSGNW